MLFTYVLEVSNWIRANIASIGCGFVMLQQFYKVYCAAKRDQTVTDTALSVKILTRVWSASDFKRRYTNNLFDYDYDYELGHSQNNLWGLDLGVVDFMRINAFLVFTTGTVSVWI